MAYTEAKTHPNAWKGVSREPLVPPNNFPISNLDPYSDEVLIDPWQTYAELQSVGSAVWLWPPMWRAIAA